MPGTPFETRALDGVSLSIADGEFVGVIGHTGSGKSTLVQHLNALLKPTLGSVYVNGLNLNDKDTNLRDVRRAVGLVFQYPEYQLFEETVRKDIAFGPNNLGLDAADVEARVREAAQIVGLSEDLLDRSPFDLSGGQKRRVAIAGVLAMRPMGLGIPACAQLANRLREKGFEIPSGMFEMEELAGAIAACLGAEGEDCHA